MFINSLQARFHFGSDEAIAILDKHSIYSEIHLMMIRIHSGCLIRGLKGQRRILNNA